MLWNEIEVSQNLIQFAHPGHYNDYRLPFNVVAVRMLDNNGEH